MFTFTDVVHIRNRLSARSYWYRVGLLDFVNNLGWRTVRGFWVLERYCWIPGAPSLSLAYENNAKYAKPGGAAPRICTTMMPHARTPDISRTATAKAPPLQFSR
eukprot:1380805-Amphidinium_carterae.1